MILKAVRQDDDYHFKSPIKCNVEDLCTGEEWGNWEDVIWEDITDNQTDNQTDQDDLSNVLKTGVSNILIFILLANI